MRGKFVVAPLVVGLIWAGQASAQASPWTGRYTVRAGDSLTAIAQHYDVSLTALADINRLSVRKQLLIGVILRVPLTSSMRKDRRAIYLVRAGDTLSGIAVRYRVSLAQLAAANGINPADVLLSGIRLRIPTGSISTLDLAHLVESDPYRHGAVGYDVSYPNCVVPVPTGRAFAIIGLNSGRPFTTNPCFQDEWAAAQPPRSVYINTAYSRTLLRHVTPDCRAAGHSQPLEASAQNAYAVGCSEAMAARQLLAAKQPSAIWLDVEPGNTWSSEPALNAATIRGILDQLLTQSPHPPIGVYSNSGFWHQIVGGWSTLNLPEWVAPAAADAPGCAVAFAAGQVWLNQTINGQLDLDTAC